MGPRIFFGGGDTCTYLDSVLCLSVHALIFMNIISIVNIVPSRKYKKYTNSERCSLLLFDLKFLNVFYYKN